MKSILIFYDYFSPAYKAGGPIRSLRNLTELLVDSCRLYIYTSAVDLGGTSLAVEKDRWVNYGSNVQVFYASNNELKIKGIYQQLKNLKPDVLYINGLFTPHTVLYPLLALHWLRLKNKVWKPKVVLAPRGMLKPSALALKANKKRVYLKIFKGLGLHKGIHWQATDPQELGNITTFSEKGASISLLGNVPLIPSPSAKRVNEKEKGKLRLASISLIARTKNLLFLLKCLKKLPAGCEVQYDIYGPVKDADYWQQLQQEAESLPPNIQLNYKGAVQPDEVTNTLQAYDCFVLPTLGENFGHAIFEALGAGVPVLISDQTPWRKLEAQQAGWDLPLKESAWVAKLKELTAMSEEEYHLWHQGAHAFAVAYLERQDLKKQYEAMFGME